MAHIMIVDDDEDFGTAIATVLDHAGHQTQIVSDTGTAMTRLEQGCPDLVILDVMFPENASAGFELARAMRQQNDKLKDVPILMLTAVNAKFPLGFGSHDIDETWLPVSEFLEKPVDFDVLEQKVDALLAQRDSKVKPSDQDV